MFDTETITPIQNNTIENAAITDTLAKTDTTAITKSPELSKYKNIVNIYPNSNTNEMNFTAIEQLLENEKQHNKTEQWTKLDKTVKIQKLHQFAEKYGKDNSLPAKDVKLLKSFFTDCLEKNKLNKTKDVLYDKEKRDITSIPALHFNPMTHNYTLKVTDTKRVSTLKCLTPRKSV